MSDERLIARIRMQALAPHLQAAAETWAARLDLPLEGDSEFALQLGEGGLQLVELGPQGHLNPASGHGPWPQAKQLIEDLQARIEARQPEPTA